MAVLPIISEVGGFLNLETTLPLKFEKVSDVNSVKLMAGVMASVPLSFFSSGGKGMVSVGFLSLPCVGVVVEAARLAEPVVEEAKVNKQMLGPQIGRKRRIGTPAPPPPPPCQSKF